MRNANQSNDPRRSRFEVSGIWASISFAAAVSLPGLCTLAAESWVPIVDLKLSGGREEIRAIGFSPDNQWLAITFGPQLYLYSVARISGRHGPDHRVESFRDEISDCIFDIDSQKIVLIDQKGTLLTYDLNSRTTLVHARRAHKRGRSRISRTSDGSYILSGGEGGKLKVWTRDVKLHEDLPTNYHGSNPIVLFAGIASDNQAVSVDSKGNVGWWYMDERRMFHSVGNHPSAGFSEFPIDRVITSAAVGAKGHVLVLGVTDSQIGAGYRRFLRLLNAKSGKVEDESGDFGRRISAVAVSPDGSLVAFGVDEAKFMVAIWDGRYHELIFKDYLKEPVTSLAFDARGTRLAVGSGSSLVRLYTTMRLERVDDELEPFGSIPRIQSKGYALLFGTDTYTYWEKDLFNPVKDVEAIGQVLETDYGFEVKVVPDPTQREIVRELREFYDKQYAPSDQLLIMFAGHGYLDDLSQIGYLVASDTEIPERDPELLSYLEYPLRLIDNLPAEHILLIVDACRAGALDPKWAFHGSPASAVAADALWKARNTVPASRPPRFIAPFTGPATATLDRVTGLNSIVRADALAHRGLRLAAPDPELQLMQHRPFHRGAASIYDDVSRSELISRKMKFRTRRYLTSGGDKYVPDGQPGGHSPFARRLLEGLRSRGGPNGDGILTFEELIAVYMDGLDPQPTWDEFGTNHPDSTFLFIRKDKGTEASSP